MEQINQAININVGTTINIHKFKQRERRERTQASFTSKKKSISDGFGTEITDISHRIWTEMCFWTDKVASEEAASQIRISSQKYFRRILDGFYANSKS